VCSVYAPTTRRLVWLGEVPWDGLPQRHHQLVRVMSKRWDVLFVEPPPALRFPKLWVSSRQCIRVAQVAPLVNARQPVLKHWLDNPRARALASRLATFQVLMAVRACWPRSDTRELDVVCSSVYLIDAASALDPSALLVDLCDDPRGFPGVPHWTHDLLVRSVRRADLVTTSSHSLQAELNLLRVDGGLHFVPNGVLGEVLRAPAPDVNSRGPVGYVGYIGPWLDFDLLERLADTLPERELHLVGPVDPSVAASVARLSIRPNVRVLGVIPECAVSETIARFAVGLIPFRLSPLTRAVNPNKLYEYAAQNLPIVTTAFSPDLEEFSRSVDICESAESFIAAVRRRANCGDRPDTRWIAESHTWAEIGAEFAGLLESAAVAPHGRGR
jgi:hypothetical protein